MRGMPARDVPGCLRPLAIDGEPQLEHVTRFVMPDERLASITGTKRVIHHGLEDPIGSVSLLLQAALGLPQCVRDFCVGGVGKRRARQSQVMNLGNAEGTFWHGESLAAP